MVEPDYACAVIEDAHGRLLLELRDDQARHAPGQVTCFGGRREDGEDAATCLVRELREELAWTPTDFSACCELWQGTRLIARFYRCRYDGAEPRTEAGRRAVWTTWADLDALPLSPWHRQVLAAVAVGTDRVEAA